MKKKYSPIPKYNPAPDEIIIEVLGDKDKRGDQTFFVYWYEQHRLWDYTGRIFSANDPEYFKGGTQAQIFHADLSAFISARKGKYKSITLKGVGHG